MKILTFLAMPIGICLINNYLIRLELAGLVDIVLDDNSVTFRPRGRF